MDRKDPSPADTVNWADWMRRWDAQQTAYLPRREARFDTMLDVLGATLPPDFVALDLACGPGSLAARLLARFPKARAVALDLDPVLLALGRGAHGDVDGRLRWAEADLADPTWTDALDGATFDAVLTTTALHWLPQAPLVRLLHDLARLVRPGDVFLNGDHFAFDPHLPTFRRVAATVKAERQGGAWTRGAEDWATWWAALEAEPGLEPLFAERRRRFARPPETYATAPIYSLHEAALKDAGFAEVGTIWQDMDNRVLLAVR